MSAYPEGVRRLVEEALRGYFPPADTRPEIIYDAMRYSLFAGGKRFRPVLTLLCAEAAGGDMADVLPCACAIEYIHTYSLIHDDLPAIDNDELRRGRPTCHREFGEDIAILAGDGLFAEAFMLIGRHQRANDPRMVVRVMAELAEAAGPRGMVGGQVVDMRSNGRAADLETVVYIHTRKTGSLIKAAARCGAILGGADETVIETIGRYGDHLGLAFQIVDDILDETGSVDELGKNPGQDKAGDKATFPAVVGCEAARREAHIQAATAISALQGMGNRKEPLIRLAEFVVERTG